MNELTLKEVNKIINQDIISKSDLIKKMPTLSKKVYCHNCKNYTKKVGLSCCPCKIWLYSNNNRNYDCKDYRKKWYLFWVKD